jgi:teichoic acid transport system ATP-binding protein
MIVGGGKPKVVVDQYNRLAVQRSPRLAKAINNCQPASSNNAGEWRGLFDFNPDEDRYGTRAAEVLEAGIFTTDCQPVQTLQRNHEYLIRVKVQYLEDMPAGIVAYTIKDPVGTILCGTNTLFQKVDMGMMSQYAVVIITFRQRILLNPGEYLLCVGVAGNEGGEYVVYDRRFDYLPFQVVSSEPRVGLFDVDSVIEWIRAN